MESNIITNIKEFNHEYERLRDDILKRHGFQKGDKVRLKSAMELEQNFSGSWLRVSTRKTDMIDRIKSYSDLNAEFRLRSLI